MTKFYSLQQYYFEHIPLTLVCIIHKNHSGILLLF